MSRTTARFATAAGLTGALLAAGVVPALASTPSTATPSPAAKAGCKTGSVPSVLVGNPGIKRQAAEGVYLGHDKQGYELKVTHPGKEKVTFTGTITASRGFSKLDDQRLEGKDFVALSANRKVLTFRFVNYGGIDGIHVGGDCSAVLHVSFKIDGKEATTSQVFLGKAHQNPTSVPFTIDRSKNKNGTPTVQAAASA